MKYIITKEREGAFTVEELQKIKVDDLPDVVRIYSDGKPKKLKRRSRPKTKANMQTNWNWNNLTEVQIPVVKELYSKKYFDEIMPILAEANVYPDTICDTCYEALKIAVGKHLKSAINSGII
mgnify:CR=1 FL=1